MAVKLRSRTITQIQEEHYSTGIQPATQTVEHDLVQILEAKLKRDLCRPADKLLGYNLNRFKSLAVGLDGIQQGLYIIGAETNVGKTAFLVNLLLDMVQTNSHVQCLYVSLDDSTDVIINRLLALLTGLDLATVQKPACLPAHSKALLLTQGYSQLQQWAQESRLHLKDHAAITTSEQLELSIKNCLSYNQHLVVYLDGLYNLHVEHKGGQREEAIAKANALKNLVDTYKVPLLATAEVRKKQMRSGDMRTSIHEPPTIQDIMESSKFAYNAQVVWMLYAQQGVKTKYAHEDLLVLSTEKNKLSACKEDRYFVFTKNSGHLTPEELYSAHEPSTSNYKTAHKVLT